MKNYLHNLLKERDCIFSKLTVILLFVICFSAVANASMSDKAATQPAKVSGRVVDGNYAPLPGVNVIIKGITKGTVTDNNGNYSIDIEGGDRILVFSFMGYLTQDISIGSRSTINVTLIEDTKSLEEVVIVGYGIQKKESIVGAIQQVQSEELKQTKGTTNLAQSLTGRLPGVTTILSTGEPGNDDPLIFIRGASTWNNAQPLILVDGVERKMNDVDVNEVETISVLKDASATAVFGVKGAEGVILITTKRGTTGKARLSLTANTGIKLISRVPEKLSSYDGLGYRNDAIEYELPVKETGWGYYVPNRMLLRYRQPQLPGDQYIFPDVDWADEMTKDFGTTTNINLNISGGTDFAKYFSSLSYSHDGDILMSGEDVGQGYKSKWGYDRFNYRINLDFNITSSTVLSVNVAGYVGTKYESYFTESGHTFLFTPFYALAPSAFPVKHEDGSWGYNGKNANEMNPVQAINTHGLEKIIRSNITTDFSLTQKLDFITDGLSVSGKVSYDNLFVSSGGIFENGSGQAKYINPDIINILPGESESDYIQWDPANGSKGFDYVVPPPTYQAEGIRIADFWNSNNNLAQTVRRLFYQAQLNYARQFGKHDLGVTALMNREEYAMGSMFTTYREDWVGRVTYNYDDRYLFESNGAYNGSEKFGEGFRFGFFPSVAVGWLASNENFLKQDWLDKFKIRYSIGKVGNDNFNSPRWAYETVWRIEDSPPFGTPRQTSPYPQYAEAVIGNPNLHWEESVKQNLGFELAILKNMFNLNIDIFKDDRTDIFMSSGQRKLPVYFGANPVAANLGETTTKGYEISLGFNNKTASDLHYWLNWSYTHAKDEIIFMEDPVLLPAYQKQEGFQIGQPRTQINAGFLNDWNDVYSSPYLSSNNGDKLPGDYRIIDFNGDGKIDSYDNAPYGYPSRPQNTYNFSLGSDYKGFNVLLQFYGVYNVTRGITAYNQIQPYGDRLEELVFKLQEDQWTKETPDASQRHGRFRSASPSGTQYYFDASYLRLKTAELGYTFNKKLLKKAINSARVYVSGNNLFFWSDLPDDREDNSGRVLYPTMKRFTLGLEINF